MLSTLGRVTAYRSPQSRCLATSDPLIIRLVSTLTCCDPENPAASVLSLAHPRVSGAMTIRSTHFRIYTGIDSRGSEHAAKQRAGDARRQHILAGQVQARNGCAWLESVGHNPSRSGFETIEPALLMGGELRGCQWRTKYATDHQRSKRGKLVREKGHHPSPNIILER